MVSGKVDDGFASEKSWWIVQEHRALLQDMRL
jgi:hypothetical protein